MTSWNRILESGRLTPDIRQVICAVDIAIPDSFWDDRARAPARESFLHILDEIEPEVLQALRDT